MASNPTTPSKPEGLGSRFKSFRSPTRAFTLGGRPASPTPTGPEGRPTPSRSSTRDSSPSTTSKSRSMFAQFSPRKSGLGSRTPSTDAVNLAAESAKTEEPASIDTPEPAKEEPKAEPAPAAAEHTPGHVRARSGSTVSTHSSHGPLTPPLPSQVAEPESISKADVTSDSPHDGASIASSRSPSRLRRTASNLSRRSISGSIRRLSLLGPGTTSPPAVETTPAIGEMETRSRSPSIGESVRRLATSPEPVPAPSSEPLTSEPEVIASEPEPIVSKSPEPAEAAPVEAPQPAATTEAPIEPPAPVAETPTSVEAPAAPVEASVPAPVETSQAEAPKPVEPQTPSKLKPSLSRNASTASLTKSPEKPEPKRRGTLTNWARRSLDRKPSGTFARPPSRGALSGDDSDTDSLKERERRWNTGREVPPVPEPKKPEESPKRRFSLGRRSSTSNGQTKTPSESASESEKKPNWATKVLRAGSKSKKDKSDSGSFATDSTAVETAEPVSISDSRPSLTIAPPVATTEPAPLSVIAESPAVQLGPGLNSLLANTAEAMKDVPVDSKPAEPAPIPEVTEAPVEIAPVDPVVAVADVVAEPESIAEVEAAPVPEPVEPESVVAAPVEEVEPAVAEEVQPADVAAASGTVTPAQIETNGVAAPPENMLSPMSPNSPSSTPWDPSAQREIARAVSPRRASAAGPSNRSRVGSPAPSIIGVKRKAVDEPDASKGRVRYLPNWAVSPAIQLAVTLSLVLPRRRRDVANPANRRSKGWWPFRRSGPRTELRYNAIRGVNEEVPVASRSWTMPAVVRTTAKVVTAPARLMFRLFVPRSSAN